MSIASDHVAFFRVVRAVGHFVDTCTITRAGVRTLNTTTGVYTSTPSTVYSGGCLVRPESPSSATVGEEQIERRGYWVELPHDANGVGIDDTVTVTSTFDGVLNGKLLTVTNVEADTYNTSRKLVAIDNQGAAA